MKPFIVFHFWVKRHLVICFAICVYSINKMTHRGIDVSALTSTQLSNQVLCVQSQMDKTCFLIFIILVNMDQTHLMQIS